MSSASPAPTTTEVVLFTRPDCHLCDQAKALMHELGGRYPHHLRLVNIEGDQSLEQRYGLRIPVVRIGAQEIAAPLTREGLAAALASLAADAT